ncbi:MAG: ATP-binding cassette domain-containing protein [Oscillospiraceae bacterium]|nr:ATP-binding cassette domain-containing protein [Oscillospiraceae bacterium]MCC8089827.1 ATP-binding cassette domain-containing protein [Oscillospiraceae bacterium]MCC8156452.1 ATP-binding cassette domain-containing protein [Oscillospiraceae bacterium]MCD7742842.1 ATP-binding cassette domain-containing protein [Oscillospiraceae bacterium]MCD7767739.1 ATP-binding cassette domain-containing protein [Oscillospiraceae bacterium]
MSALVEIKGLKKYFDTPKGKLHAVDDVTMSFERGHTMGVVGESGCGKSTLGRTIIHLLESTGGSIYYEGRDVTHLKSKELKALRENMQIIFQDPFSSVNPRFTVEDTLKEVLLRSGRATRANIDAEVTKLMDLVGIARRFRMAYPHELDGGRRQRVCIGRALAMNPKFVVCDEPVSALDVSIQAQVLNLLLDLQESTGLTYMFVTHDLSVVRYISDNISVMYLGQLVETSESEELFERPLHPYTQALLSAIPSTDIHKKKKHILIKGELTSPVEPKPGCRFASRCPLASEECLQPQTLREVTPGHFVQCCKVEG